MPGWALLGVIVGAGAAVLVVGGSKAAEVTVLVLLFAFAVGALLLDPVKSDDPDDEDFDGGGW